MKSFLTLVVCTVSLTAFASVNQGPTNSNCAARAKLALMDSSNPPVAQSSGSSTNSVKVMSGKTKTYGP